MKKRFESENFPPEIQKKADQMNLDEALIPPYSVPVPSSSSASEFINIERKRLLSDFARYIYGEIPPRCEKTEFITVAEADDAFDGLAKRREIEIRCRSNGVSRTLNLLLYLPKYQKGKVPVFFGMNFRGNHASCNDPGIRYTVTKRYPSIDNSPRKSDNRSPADVRGAEKDRLCLEKIIKRGYAAATMCYWDVYPDHPYGFNDSILPMFFDEQTFMSVRRPAGAISAWAWGYQRAVDCLEAQSEIDSCRIAVHGHSRLGKTALWAGANDTRIALTVSCCSGCLGAKLSRRYMGEDFSWIEQWNPHWTSPEFKKYIDRDRDIPVDQNQLIGCIAPRPVFIFSASEDEYADPKGEFLAAYEASQFYRLCGLRGLGTDTMPPPDTAVGEDIGYFCHTGDHNFYPGNWDVLLDFTDKLWQNDHYYADDKER